MSDLILFEHPCNGFIKISIIIQKIPILFLEFRDKIPLKYYVFMNGKKQLFISYY